jgi:hypothetical protein
VAIATHDERLVWGSEQTITRLGLTRNDYEFQMLLGVLPNLRRNHPRSRPSPARRRAVRDQVVCLLTAKVAQESRDCGLRLAIHVQG